MRRAWLLAVAVLGPYSPAVADEPAGKKYEVVTPKDDGIIATGINGRGDVIGFEWVDDKDHPGVVSQAPFFAKGKEMTYLPLLDGYTATFPAGVSDDGVVVGRSSKPAPPGVVVKLRNQGFVWDAARGIRGLGVLPGDFASFASDISGDGRRISGYSVGQDRVRACIWERDGDGWTVAALPESSQLGSQVVPMSDDGKFIAAVERAQPCLWSSDASGKWTRELLGDPGSLVPRSVNNSGVVAGIRHTGDGLTHAVLWTRDGGLTLLEKPEGYVRSEANAINNAGVVVGTIDGPSGSPVGPNAFVYEDGRVRVIDEGGPNFASATAINDKGQISGVVEKDEEE